MSKKSILMITESNYPEGDAGAVRQHCFAKLFSELNYTVEIACLGKDSFFEEKTFEGVKYVSFRKPSRSKIIKAENYLVFFRHIRHYYGKKLSMFDVFFVVNVTPMNFVQIKRFCKNSSINLVHDCVEWYSPSEFALGRLAPSYISKSLINSFIIDRNVKVVSISEYLRDYFTKKGIESIRIPVIMDINSIEVNHKIKNDKCTFVYAGNPGRKDKLNPMIYAMSRLPKQILDKMVFKIIGIDKDTLSQNTGISVTELDKLGDSLVVMGRLPRNSTVDEVRKADFSVLFRDASQTFAKAGFPTKVVEAMSVGTPMFCNLSSDLQMYLDGNNAIITNSVDIESVTDLLITAIDSKNTRKYSQLQSNAYSTALNCFDYRLYKGVLQEFLCLERKNEC